MSAPISLPESDALRQHSYLKAMHSNKKIVRKIEPRDLGVPRNFSDFESDLWNAVNRIIHHHTLTPVTFAQPDFYHAGNGAMPGYLIADVRVKSDRGVSIVNVAGFAIAATNELGELALKPQKVFH